MATGSDYIKLSLDGVVQRLSALDQGTEVTLEFKAAGEVSSCHEDFTRFKHGFNESYISITVKRNYFSVKTRDIKSIIDFLKSRYEKIPRKYQVVIDQSCFTVPYWDHHTIHLNREEEIWFKDQKVTQITDESTISYVIRTADPRE